MSHASKQVSLFSRTQPDILAGIKERQMKIGLHKLIIVLRPIK